MDLQHMNKTNTSYFGNWGTHTPKRSKPLSHIITWLIPGKFQVKGTPTSSAGESEQEFQKATKTLHPLLPLKKRKVTLKLQIF